MAENFWKKNTILIIIFSFLLILSACSLPKETSFFSAPSDIVIDTIKQVYVVNDKGINETNYRIKSNDLIAIRNIQNKKFGATASTSYEGTITPNSAQSNVVSYPVEPDGIINLPALGKVQIANLTIREARNKIQQLYADNLLVDPIIELNVINLKVILLGEFAKQGNFFLQKDNTDLIEIIGEAGGITKAADKKSLRIIRGDRKNPEIIYVNLGDINSLASKKLILQNNDIITLQALKEPKISERVQNFNSFMQPILLVINLGILIFTLTK